jgi:hypothetical protein
MQLNTTGTWQGRVAASKLAGAPQLGESLMKKGCAIAFLVVAVVILGAATTIYFAYQSWANPYYHGKRVYSWADQAMYDPDSAARREATQALIEAFNTMQQGEARIQLTMRFCYARKNDQGNYDLPKEVIPFLVETLHAQEMPACPTYPAIALSQVEGDAAVTPLIDVILHDKDTHAQASATYVLGLMGPRAKEAQGALQHALESEDEEVRSGAAQALRQISK